MNVEKLNEFNSKNKFAMYCKLEITDAGDDYVTGRMPFEENYQNRYGSMHGGSVYAMADTIGGLLAANVSGHFVTTVDGHMSYLAPAMDTEYVYCKAKLLRAGNKLVYTDIKIYGDDDKLFCTGNFNYYNMRGLISESE
ncbi:MAG: PaaI family thioesterase [Lachnospiraceae bacterium]|nr:PaaI family thioesterase [Lachnospiraceae bacterium]